MSSEPAPVQQSDGLKSRIASWTALLVAVAALADAATAIATKTQSATCILGVPLPWCAKPTPAAATAPPKEPVPSESIKHDLAITPPIVLKTLGWANFGVLNNGKWTEKHFEISGAPSRAPRPGDIIVAKSSVNVRVAPIEDTPDGWQNQPKAGDPTVIGYQYNVDRVLEVYPGFYWVEIQTK